MLVFVMLTFQTKNECKEIGVKTHADNANRMEEGMRHTNPMGLTHVIGRNGALVHNVYHKKISVKLKPA